MDNIDILYYAFLFSSLSHHLDYKLHRVGIVLSSFSYPRCPLSICWVNNNYAFLLWVCRLFYWQEMAVYYEFFLSCVFGALEWALGYPMKELVVNAGLAELDTCESLYSSVPLILPVLLSSIFPSVLLLRVSRTSIKVNQEYL